MPDLRVPTNPQPPIPNPSSRQPVPDPAALAAAAKQADDLFKTDAEGATTPVARSALARRILQQAAEIKGDPAGRYALLQAAQNMALKAGDLKTAFAVVDRMTEGFEVDGPALKAEILNQQVKAAKTTAAHKPLLDRILAVTDEAIDQGSFDAAETLLKLATAESPRFRSKKLIEQIKGKRARLDEAIKSFGELQTAQATLAKDAKDTAACAIVGRYLCFAKGDWAAGLPLLARGSDEGIKELAGRELALVVSPPHWRERGWGEGTRASKADDLVSLADDWWDVAQPLGGSQREAVRLHAAIWYRQAVVQLGPGIAKMKVEERLAEAGKLQRNLSPPPPAIRLLMPKRPETINRRGPITWACRWSKPTPSGCRWC